MVAYVAAITGVGLSLSTAAYIRWVLIVTCFGLLSYIAVKRLVHFARREPSMCGCPGEKLIRGETGTHFDAKSSEYIGFSPGGSSRLSALRGDLPRR